MYFSYEELTFEGAIQRIEDKRLNVIHKIKQFPWPQDLNEDLNLVEQDNRECNLCGFEYEPGESICSFCNVYKKLDLKLAKERYDPASEIDDIR